ncbi:MAG TPA: cysteine-rich CWC family protein [Ferruginibacter sp.]|nr:cysteine-rich CWC family protein [Ferruginibacter sp.]
MRKHETISCCRCNINFECKPGSINQCQCNVIQLTVEEKVYIELKYDDCLCINCLKAMQQEYVLFKEKHIFNK